MKSTTMFIWMFLVTACSGQVEEWEKPSAVTLGCEDYRSIEVPSGVLYNNVWNKDAAQTFAWRQCLEQRPKSKTPVYGWSWHWPSEGNQIFAYPQIKIGSSPWDPMPKFDDRFPVKLDRLESLVVSHSLDISTNGQHNVATTMWLTHSPDIGDTQNKSIIAAEVMIWTYATAEHMAPAGKRIGDILLNGKAWSVWLEEDWTDASGENANNWIYLAFHADEPSLSSNFDAKALISHDLVSNLELGAYYLADVELGTEIMHGSGIAWVEDFTVELKERDQPPY